MKCTIWNAFMDLKLYYELYIPKCIEFIYGLKIHSELCNLKYNIHGHI